MRFDDGVIRSVGVHVLVAEAFVPNPEGYEYVRPIDRNMANCRADNLKWEEKCVERVMKPIIGVNADGDEVRYGSLKEAAGSFGKKYATFVSCFRDSIERGGRAYGYKWEYVKKKRR
jgi:hypothetical protein